MTKKIFTFLFGAVKSVDEREIFRGEGLFPWPRRFKFRADGPRGARKKEVISTPDRRSEGSDMPGPDRAERFPDGSIGILNRHAASDVCPKSFQPVNYS